MASTMKAQAHIVDVFGKLNACISIFAITSCAES
jgi:hypothetical protein